MVCQDSEGLYDISIKGPTQTNLIVFLLVFDYHAHVFYLVFSADHIGP